MKSTNYFIEFIFFILISHNDAAFGLKTSLSTWQFLCHIKCFVCFDFWIYDVQGWNCYNTSTLLCSTLSSYHHHGQKEEVYSIRRDAITVYWHKKCSSKNVMLLFPLICENSKTCLEKIMINPSKKNVYLIIMITGKSYSNPSVCLIDNNIWPNSFSIEKRWCRYSNNAKIL